ncbi:hypothetical protein HDEF_0994 [Candidatus Hamiltonella defensa 5AT (Acyrthosiphon pisum)]|uniref:Uncharacterized protein n=1 Tax=Hamiltonella defensa subsp. Acyrthosiphon pisum (strain 5AT) TaxID=572265 RepID=C4K553_HAMD5|nr:hypothetical protein HDEF_0994 [Candidatus Hamiltonella defensa 5AT (Acyrthosiphon pisum)]
MMIYEILISSILVVFIKLNFQKTLIFFFLMPFP